MGLHRVVQHVVPAIGAFLGLGDLRGLFTPGATSSSRTKAAKIRTENNRYIRMVTPYLTHRHSNRESHGTAGLLFRIAATRGHLRLVIFISVRHQHAFVDSKWACVPRHR